MSNSVNPLFIKLCIPDGLEEVLEGLAREVLRRQPTDINRFAAVYFQKLLTIRNEAESCGAQISLKNLIGRGKFIDIKENEFQAAKSWQTANPQKEILSEQDIEISETEVKKQTGQNDLNDFKENETSDEIVTLDNAKDEDLVPREEPTEFKVNQEFEQKENDLDAQENIIEIESEKIEPNEETAVIELGEIFSQNVEEDTSEKSNQEETYENKTRERNLMTEDTEEEPQEHTLRSEITEEEEQQDLKFQRIEEEKQEQNVSSSDYNESSEQNLEPKYTEEPTTENFNTDVMQEEFSEPNENADKIEEESSSSKQNFMTDVTEDDLLEENVRVKRSLVEDASEQQTKQGEIVEMVAPKQNSFSDYVEQFPEPDLMGENIEELSKEPELRFEAIQEEEEAPKSLASGDPSEEIFKMEAIEENPKEYEFGSEDIDKAPAKQNLVSEHSEEEPSEEVLKEEVIVENTNKHDVAFEVIEEKTPQQNLDNGSSSEQISEVETIEENPKELELGSELFDATEKLELVSEVTDSSEKHNLLPEYLEETPPGHIFKVEITEENSEHKLESVVTEENLEQYKLGSEVTEENSKEYKLESEVTKENSEEYKLRSEVTDETAKQNLVSEYMEEELPEQKFKVKAIKENPEDYDLRSESTYEETPRKDLNSENIGEEQQEQNYLDEQNLMEKNTEENSTDENLIFKNISLDESLIAEIIDKEEPSTESPKDITKNDEESSEDNLKLKAKEEKTEDETMEMDSEENGDEKALGQHNLLKETDEESLELNLEPQSMISYENRPQQNITNVDIDFDKVGGNLVQENAEENALITEDNEKNTLGQNLNLDCIENDKNPEINVIITERETFQQILKLKDIENNLSEQNSLKSNNDEQIQVHNLKQKDTEETLETNLKQEDIEELLETNLKQEHTEETLETNLKQEDIEELLETSLKQDTDQLLDTNLKQDDIEELLDTNLKQEDIEVLLETNLKQENTEELSETSLKQEDTDQLLETNMKQEDIEEPLETNLKQEDTEEPLERNLKKEDTEEPLERNLKKEDTELKQNGNSEQAENILENQAHKDAQESTEQNVNREDDKEQPKEILIQSVIEISTKEKDGDVQTELDSNIQKTNEADSIVSLIVVDPEQNNENLYEQDEMAIEEPFIKEEIPATTLRIQFQDEDQNETTKEPTKEMEIENENSNVPHLIPEFNENTIDEVNDYTDETDLKQQLDDLSEETTYFQVGDPVDPLEVPNDEIGSMEQKQKSENEELVITELNGTIEELEELEAVAADPIVQETDETEEMSDKPIDDEDIQDIFGGSELDTIVEENSEAEISISSLLPEYKTEQETPTVESDSMVATTETFRDDRQIEEYAPLEVQHDEPDGKSQHSDTDILMNAAAMTTEPLEIQLTSDETNEVELDGKNREYLHDNYNGDNNSHTEIQSIIDYDDEISNPATPLQNQHAESKETNELIESEGNSIEGIVSSTLNDEKEIEQLKEGLTISDGNNNEDIYKNVDEDSDEISDTRNTVIQLQKSQPILDAVMSQTNEKDTKETNDDDDTEKTPTVNIEMDDIENINASKDDIQQSFQIILEKNAEGGNQKSEMRTDYAKDESIETTDKQTEIETRELFEPPPELGDQLETLNQTGDKTGMLNNNIDGSSIDNLRHNVTDNNILQEEKIQTSNADNNEKPTYQLLITDKTEDTNPQTQIHIEINGKSGADISKLSESNDSDAETSKVRNNDVDEETGEYVSTVIKTQSINELFNITKETEPNEVTIKEPNLKTLTEEQINSSTNVLTNDITEQFVISDASKEDRKDFENEVTLLDNNTIDENFMKVTEKYELNESIDEHSETSMGIIDFENSEVGTNNTKLAPDESDIETAEMNTESIRSISNENNSNDKAAEQNITHEPYESTESPQTKLHDSTKEFVSEGSETPENSDKISNQTYEKSKDEIVISNFNVRSDHQTDQEMDSDIKDQKSISFDVNHQDPESLTTSNDQEETDKQLLESAQTMEQNPGTGVEQSEVIIRQDNDESYIEKKDEFIRALIENITLEHNDDNKESKTENEYFANDNNNVEMMEDEQIEMTSRNDDDNENVSRYELTDVTTNLSLEEEEEPEADTKMDKVLETDTESEANKDTSLEIVNNAAAATAKIDADLTDVKSKPTNGTESVMKETKSKEDVINNAFETLDSIGEENSDETKSSLENEMSLPELGI